MQSKKAYIFTNKSSICPIDKKDKSIVFIAADGGFNSLAKGNLLPDILIGDLDSIALGTKEKCLKNNIPILQFETNKDETDTQLAIRWCFDNQIENITIFNSLQSRFDHSLGLISNLLYATSLGISAKVISESQEVFLLAGSFVYLGELGDTLSIIPITKELKSLSTKGLKYTLKNESLLNNSTRGISNVIINKKVSIQAKGGLGIVVITKRRGYAKEKV